jgi:syntaxin 8
VSSYNDLSLFSGARADSLDQDDRLNLLSHSIGRQNHLSLQIGSELEEQHELLEDVDGAMARTTARLGGARKRLDKVANDAKQYGELVSS